MFVWVRGLASVLDDWAVAVLVSGVGHSLETTVGQGNVVLSLGKVVVAAFLVSEVVVAVVLDSVLPGVVGFNLWEKNAIYSNCIFIATRFPAKFLFV